MEIDYEMITPTQFAHKFHESRQNIYRWIRLHRLGTRKRGTNRVLLGPQDVERLIELSQQKDRAPVTRESRKRLPSRDSLRIEFGVDNRDVAEVGYKALRGHFDGIIKQLFNVVYKTQVKTVPPILKVWFLWFLMEFPPVYEWPHEYVGLKGRGGFWIVVSQRTGRIFMEEETVLKRKSQTEPQVTTWKDILSKGAQK